MSIDRLSADDLMMLRAGDLWPQYIGALALLDGDALLDSTGAIRLDAVRAAIESRLHLVPRFRQVLHVPRWGLGPPVWVDARAFDIRDHVRAQRVPSPGREGELLEAVEDLRVRPLDSTRPLWEMWFLYGLSDGRVALFVRIHHAVADGMAAMVAFGAFLDPEPATSVAGPPWTPAGRPRAPVLLLDNLRRRLGALRGGLSALRHPKTTLEQVRTTLPALRELVAEEPATLIGLNRLVGRDRGLAALRTTEAAIREIGDAHHATSNDVLLALTAGGIRAVLAGRGEPVAKTTIRLYVPVSMRRGRIRRSGMTGRGNLISQMAVPVSLRNPNPAARLHEIAAETARRRRRRRIPLGQWFHQGPITRLLLKAITRQRVNVTTAYLRGPRSTMFAFGAEMGEVYPIIPLIGNVTLGVGAVSYAGALEIGIAADRLAYPDLDVLVEGMRAELDALSRSAQAGLIEPPAQGAEHEDAA